MQVHEGQEKGATCAVAPFSIKCSIVSFTSKSLPLIYFARPL